MSDTLTFQPGVSLNEGRYLLRSAGKPGRWSITIHGIRASDLTAVIIKTPLKNHGQYRFQSAWMRRSFQALRDLNHPSRARMLDWFEQDGRPFLVMQKVKGASLEQQLQKGPMTEAVALQLIRQVAAGLAGIHSQGLLHRDIQPKNIISRQGVGIPTLVDWGLQRGNGTPESLTPFSGPEQLWGKDIFKNRLDIYSLAATLYAAVTGQDPLHPAKRQHQVPNPDSAAPAGLILPSHLRPDLSSATENAILQGMTLDPTQRPATLESWLNLFPLTQSQASDVSGRSPSPRTPQPSHFKTGNSNSGQLWATQPPPSKVSAKQASGTFPPGSSALSNRATSQKSPAPSLPERPTSPTSSGGNSALGNPSESYPSQRLGHLPASNATSHPSEWQQSRASKVGTVTPSSASKSMGLRSTDSSSYASNAMASAAQRSSPTASPAPFRSFKRLVSVSLLTASIGLAGGLLLRVLNPGSVSGFSGLGRVQDFPEADWPGKTQLDDIPEDVPQPEYSNDLWDEAEEEMPDLILDEDVVQDEVLAAPSEGFDDSDSASNLTVEDYSEALEASGAEDYGNEAYSEDIYDDGQNAEYAEDPYSSEEEYVEQPYAGDDSAAIEEDYAGAEEDFNAGPEDWSEDPWVEEAPGDWSEAPSITADDFPEPDLPPTYDAPASQGVVPLPDEAAELYEDV